MMRDIQPILLDLFCGAGGATRGYQLAGFYVIGVDNNASVEKHYCGDEFYQDNALLVLDTLLSGKSWNGYRIQDIACIHTSPECKAYTNCNLSPKENYLKLIGEVRKRLQVIGKPYIIENVVGAKRDLQASLLLCGSMFGLPMQRHRLFESNVYIPAPSMCNHKHTSIGVYGHSIWDSSLPGTPRKDGKKRPDSVSIDVGRKAMGIDWMTIEELAESIPPAYTLWIGGKLQEYIAGMEEDALLQQTK